MWIAPRIDKLERLEREQEEISRRLAMVQKRIKQQAAEQKKLDATRAQMEAVLAATAPPYGLLSALADEAYGREIALFRFQPGPRGLAAGGIPYTPVTAELEGGLTALSGFLTHTAEQVGAFGLSAITLQTAKGIGRFRLLCDLAVYDLAAGKKGSPKMVQ